jgi:hypothetical protein
VSHYYDEEEYTFRAPRVPRIAIKRTPPVPRIERLRPPTPREEDYIVTQIDDADAQFQRMFKDRRSNDIATAKTQMAESLLALSDMIDKTIISFDKTFDGEKFYTFAAVKSDDKWYLTGIVEGAHFGGTGGRTVVSTTDLIIFMMVGVPVRQVDRMVPAAGGSIKVTAPADLELEPVKTTTSAIAVKRVPKGQGR